MNYIVTVLFRHSNEPRRYNYDDAYKAAIAAENWATSGPKIRKVELSVILQTWVIPNS